MPCYVVVKVSVVFKMKNLEFLKEALSRAMGTGLINNVNVRGDQVSFRSGYYQYNIDLKREKITYDQGADASVPNKLKQLYSLSAVEKLAKKRKLAVMNKQVDQKNNKLKMELRRF